MAQPPFPPQSALPSRRERRLARANGQVPAPQAPVEPAPAPVASTPAFAPSFAPAPPSTPTFTPAPPPGPAAPVGGENFLPQQNTSAISVITDEKPDFNPAVSGEAAAEETSQIGEETRFPVTQKRVGAGVKTASIVGEIMITAGLVLALFVFWQLYVTSWEVAGATSTAVTSFTSSLPETPTQLTEERRTDPPPPVSLPAVGKTFATLHVPKWDSMVIPIAQGESQWILDTGYAGHYSLAFKTQGPGEVGNFALAAHRRSYGNSFRRVEELVDGDPLIVETRDAWLVYRVTTHQIVLPQQVDVIDPVPGHPGQKPVDRLMTLTTCHPEYGNSHRYIVHSKLEYWVPRDAGRPSVLEQTPAAAPN